jgi:hypothetical protein
MGQLLPAALLVKLLWKLLPLILRLRKRHPLLVLRPRLLWRLRERCESRVLALKVVSTKGRV